jgi:hypothetical protein
MRGAAVRLTVIIGVVALSVAAARAADPAREADELIKQGFQLRLQGKNAEALQLFEKAHAMAPSGKTIAQIGVAEVALRRWVDAEAHLQDALVRHDSPWTDLPKNREMLEKTLAEARKQIALVRLSGTPGAEISVDGRRIGVLPIGDPIHVAAGTIRIRATAPGLQPVEKEVAARGGEETTTTLELSIAVAVPAAAPPVLVAAEKPPQQRRSTWRTWTGMALGAVGLAAAGTGVAWLVVDGRPTCSAPAGSVCQNLYDTSTQGWLAVGIGVAALGSGATLLLWPERGGSARAGLNVGPGALMLTGRF